MYTYLGVQKDNKSWANDQLYYTDKSYSYSLWIISYNYLLNVDEAFSKTQHLFMMQPKQLKI